MRDSQAARHRHPRARRKRAAGRVAWDPDLNPVRLAFLHKPASREDLLSLRVRELLVIDALGQARASRADLRLLLVGMRCGLALCEAGYSGDGVRVRLEEGHRLVLGLWRARAATPAGAATEAIETLREALAVLDVQREQAPRAALERALAAAIRGL